MALPPVASLCPGQAPESKAKGDEVQEVPELEASAGMGLDLSKPQGLCFWFYHTSSGRASIFKGTSESPQWTS